MDTSLPMLDVHPTAESGPESATEALPLSRNSPSPRDSARDARAQASRAEAAIDAELIARFKQGDEGAFAQIVARYRDKIQAIAGRLLRNQADAEEIAQDTFIRAHRGLDAFRGECSLSTWLCRIAFNLSRNRYWYFFRRGRHLTMSMDLPLGDDTNATISDLVAAHDADPAQQATVDEFLITVAACMDKLHPGHREILTLRNLLHHSYEEIARALGTNEGTVKSRIARARNSLRGLMAEACPEFAVGDGADWFEPSRGAGRLA
jgi:RNA polymerase sigma-70 factor, ECF subfamily